MSIATLSNQNIPPIQKESCHTETISLSMPEIEFRPFGIQSSELFFLKKCKIRKVQISQRSFVIRQLKKTLPPNYLWRLHRPSTNCVCPVKGSLRLDCFDKGPLQTLVKKKGRRLGRGLGTLKVLKLNLSIISEKGKKCIFPWNVGTVCWIQMEVAVVSQKRMWLCLKYSKRIYVGWPVKTMQKLQLVQNAVSCLVPSID